MKYIPYGKQYLDHHDFNAVSKSLKQDLITTGESVKTFEKNVKIFLDQNMRLVVTMQRRDYILLLNQLI